MTKTGAQGVLVDLVQFLEEAVGKGGFHNNGMLQKEGGHHRNISQ